MNCPACAAHLSTLTVPGLSVDICRDGCGGIWFDNFELRRVDEANEPLSEAISTVKIRPADVVITSKRPCPKCVGIIMLQRQFSRTKPVLVDECPNCGGIWLDGGELDEIRQPSVSDTERKKAAQQFLRTLFDADMERLKARRTEQ